MEKKFKYPGIPTTSDGTGAIVWVETNITQGACAYPITPSTEMGVGFQRSVANGQTNLWGDELAFIEPESEHSSASACEGFALAGGRIANFTSGQGLVLMKEVLYTIAGKRLPVVFNIGARALTSHSLNVHAGHDDVMAVADTGWGMVFGKNAQDACDLSLISRKVAEKCETPFMSVTDGFLTTHTVENVLLPEKEFMKEFVGKPEDHIWDLMTTSKPIMSGVVQNQDSYMKGKIAQRMFTDKILQEIKDTMQEFYELTGRKHSVVESYKLEDAEYAVVGMGSFMETAMVTADYLREQGIKAGVLHVKCFRPFPANEVVDALKHLKGFSVLERMDNPLAESNPLTTEIKSSFIDALNGVKGHHPISRVPLVLSGSGGLGSRDVRPGDIVSIFKNMICKEAERKDYFSVGIDHETSLKMKEDPDVRPKGAFSMRGHSVGGFGSVTTNKVIATIAADVFDLNVQAYPKYGSEKKGLPTTYYLTIAHGQIMTHCELNRVEFIPLNDINAFNVGNPLTGLSKNGMVFLQTSQTDPKVIWDRIPGFGKKIIWEQNARIFALDTKKIAREVASTPELIQRMQGIVLLGIFLKVTPFMERDNLDYEHLISGVEKSIRKYFGKRGERVVQDNLKCVEKGFNEVFEIPQEIISGESS
ncbi:MAG: pyruvate ferredoxin oxidoreductase [Calditrichaeota bacterium]|nr:MAG: pyruvate ferredoxin oxidoreductase [Calditrichota bacterium]